MPSSHMFWQSIIIAIVLALTIALTASYKGRSIQFVPVQPDTVYVKVVNVPVPEPEVEYADRFGISTNLARKIVFYADKHGIDRDIAHGLVAVESRFDPMAVSHVGARGLTQLMRRTAGEILGEIPDDSTLHDVDTNLDTGMHYLAYLLERFDGDIHLALAAYNAGPTRIGHLIANNRQPRKTYSGKVLAEAGK